MVRGLLDRHEWARQTTLAGITGPEKGITYTTDTMDPRAAAAAMLKDVN